MCVCVSLSNFVQSLKIDEKKNEKERLRKQFKTKEKKWREKERKNKWVKRIVTEKFGNIFFFNLNNEVEINVYVRKSSEPQQQQQATATTTKNLFSLLFSFHFIFFSWIIFGCLTVFWTPLEWHGWVSGGVCVFVYGRTHQSGRMCSMPLMHVSSEYFSFSPSLYLSMLRKYFLSRLRNPNNSICHNYILRFINRLLVLLLLFFAFSLAIAMDYQTVARQFAMRFAMWNVYRCWKRMFLRKILLLIQSRCTSMWLPSFIAWLHRNHFMLHRMNANITSNHKWINCDWRSWYCAQQRFFKWIEAGQEKERKKTVSFEMIYDKTKLNHFLTRVRIESKVIVKWKHCCRQIHVLFSVSFSIYLWMEAPLQAIPEVQEGNCTEKQNKKMTICPINRFNVPTNNMLSHTYGRTIDKKITSKKK